MKFVIQRDRLLASIQDVVKAISSRTAIPILTGMKIEAKEDGITLTGSDSDISIESFIPKEEDGIVYGTDRTWQHCTASKVFPGNCS
jgi:DNA polymerase III subunit beta